MTREEIAAVLDREPTLNDEGMGLSDSGRGLTAEERSGRLQSLRQSLLGRSDEASKAEAWLASKGKTKSARDGRSSYGLKHDAEPEIGYVSNGAFIAAAIHCGFAYEVEPGSLNPRIGISRRSLRA